MSDLLSEARIRTQRYWLRDGLDEITLGVICLMMGAWTLARAKASWFMPSTLIYILLCVTFAIFVPHVKAALRERVTYRRSGYAAQSGGWRKRLVFVLVALVVTGVLWFAGRAGLDSARTVQWTPAVAGTAMGMVCTYVSVRQGLRRFLVVGVFAMLLGVAVSIAYPPSLAWAIYIIGFGSASLCSGGVTMRNYLRTAPASADET